MIESTHMKKPAFTLIELLVVITIIGILAGLALMVINPQKYLGDSRNTRRRVDLHSISLTISQYAIDKGSLPTGITPTPIEICRSDSMACSGLLDLGSLVRVSKYISAIPVDPSSTSVNGSGYWVHSENGSFITLTAPLAENGLLLEITR